LVKDLFAAGEGSIQVTEASIGSIDLKIIQKTEEDPEACGKLWGR
jgi:hypothetical protein